jgi:hypothetical protein
MMSLDDGAQPRVSAVAAAAVEAVLALAASVPGVLLAAAAAVMQEKGSDVALLRDMPLLPEDGATPLLYLHILRNDRGWLIQPRNPQSGRLHRLSSRARQITKRGRLKRWVTDFGWILYPMSNWILDTIHSKPYRPRISSTELREKLLREKLVAMRRTASHDKVGGNTTASK